MLYPLIDTNYKPDAVILANGDYPTHPIPAGVLQRAPYICCCDGAAMQLAAHGLQPDAIVGDGDSLSNEQKNLFQHILHLESEQDDNDLTKATRHCKALGFNTIAYLGATGKREDHTLGNISLMARYMDEMGINATLFTDYGWFTSAKGDAQYKSFEGQQVSIFNLTCTKIEAEGLKWQPYAYRQWWQGTLNEAMGCSFCLHADGIFMVFRTYNRK